MTRIDAHLFRKPKPCVRRQAKPFLVQACVLVMMSTFLWDLGLWRLLPPRRKLTNLAKGDVLPGACRSPASPGSRPRSHADHADGLPPRDEIPHVGRPLRHSDHGQFPRSEVHGGKPIKMSPGNAAEASGIRRSGGRSQSTPLSLSIKTHPCSRRPAEFDAPSPSLRQRNGPGQSPLSSDRTQRLHPRFGLWFDRLKDNQNPGPPVASRKEVKIDHPIRQTLFEASTLNEVVPS